MSNSQFAARNRRSRTPRQGEYGPILGHSAGNAGAVDPGHLLPLARILAETPDLALWDVPGLVPDVPPTRRLGDRGNLLGNDARCNPFPRYLR